MYCKRKHTLISSTKPVFHEKRPIQRYIQLLAGIFSLLAIKTNKKQKSPPKHLKQTKLESLFQLDYVDI